MKILVTAFTPFGGEPQNAAETVLQRLSDRIGEAEICKLLVPTEFAASVQTVEEAIQADDYHAVLMLGQAAGRAQLTPERVAINVDDARIPDNAGSQPVDKPIRPDGPAAYFSTLPIRAMAEAIQAAGVPAAISNSAGTFVCNHLMYGVLDFLREASWIQAGFLHVPITPEQATSDKIPSLPIEDIEKGVVAALEVIASTVQMDSKKREDRKTEAFVRQILEQLQH